MQHSSVFHSSFDFTDWLHTFTIAAESHNKVVVPAHNFNISVRSKIKRSSWFLLELGCACYGAFFESILSYCASGTKTFLVEFHHQVAQGKKLSKYTWCIVGVVRIARLSNTTLVPNGSEDETVERLVFPS